MFKLDKMIVGKVLGFMKKNLWLWLATLVIAVILGIGSQYLFKKKDHPVEQMCEEVIKDMTGLELDFSK